MTTLTTERAVPRHPTDTTLAWVRESVGRGTIIATLAPMSVASTTLHAVDVLGPSGVRHELVLRRYHRTDRLESDPWYDPANEATVLGLLAGTDVPAPRLLAADLAPRTCEVPTLLTTRVPGVVPPPGQATGSFVAALAATLVTIHAVGQAGWPDPPGPPARVGTPLGGPAGPASAASVAVRALPTYRPYFSTRLDGGRRPPAWSKDPAVWDRVFTALETRPPTGPWGFIHRDYHPGQTLWDGDRVVGVVDWTTGCCGPRGIDLARMRLNLAGRYGIDVADRFLDAYRALAGGESPTRTRGAAGHPVRHPYWDLLDAADVLLDLAAPVTAAGRAEHDRFEDWVARCLSEL